MMKTWRPAMVAVSSVLALALASCASGPSDSNRSGDDSGNQGDVLTMEIGKLNFDPTKYCGEKPMKIGHLTAAGGNNWMAEVKALIEKFETFCPNVTDIQYYDANGDVTKFSSAVNAWAAQDFDIIYAFAGYFGEQTLPAFRAAQAAGVKVAVGNVAMGNDAVPDSVTASVVTDIDSIARSSVDFFEGAKEEGTSKILMIGGPAGSPMDPQVIASMKSYAKESDADIEFLQDEPLVGNAEIAKSAEAAAGALQKHPEIDGIVMTNVAVAPAVIRVFQNAGRKVPAIAGVGATSGAICALEKIREADPNAGQMLTLDGSPNFAPLALAKAIAAFQGIDAPELGLTDAETYIDYTPFVDTLNRKMPECDPSLPADADPTAALTAEEIKAAVN